MDSTLFSGMPEDLSYMQISLGDGNDISIDFESANTLLEEFLTTEVSEENLAAIAKSIVSIPSAIRDAVAKAFSQRGDMERWSKANQSMISSVESAQADTFMSIAKKTQVGLKRKLSVILDKSEDVLSTLGTKQRLEEARFASDAVLTGIMKGTDSYMATVKDNSQKLRKLLVRTNGAYKIAIDTEGAGPGTKLPVDSIEDLKAIRVNIEASQKEWSKVDTAIEGMIADWTQSAGTISNILADKDSSASVKVGFVKLYADYIKAGLELLDRYGLVRTQQERVANTVKRLYTAVSENI